jgi:hypothetical protein
VKRRIGTEGEAGFHCCGCGTFLIDKHDPVHLSKIEVNYFANFFGLKASCLDDSGDGFNLVAPFVCLDPLAKNPRSLTR